jgi:hypothetical protein
MSEKIIPNEGSYLGAKKFPAIKAKKVQDDEVGNPILLEVG